FFTPLEAQEATGSKVVTSLIAYAYELFDSRSGYPAGIRDPLWQERVHSALSCREPIETMVSSAIVAVCTDVRNRGHVAGVPDAKEAVRMSIDLARLRGLPAPGRREVLEAIESTLARGELFGRGRVLAKALDRVFVGRKRGRLAPGTPRSGLFLHVRDLLETLKLPGPEDQSRD